MAGRIKGITIELGADTTSLEGALSDVNKKSRDLQKELKDVEKLLKFDPNNTELLAQRQELLARSVENTRDKLNQLKQAEAQVQAQFQRGDIKEEQYRAFQRELQDTERTLQRFEGSLQDMQVEQDNVGDGQRRLTRLFEATGSSVEDFSNLIGQRLVRAIQNGTATSRDLENAFQRISREALGSRVDIERLRESLQSVDDGNSLENVRRDLQRIAQEASEAEREIADLDIGIENIAGALVAGVGISGAIEKALDNSSVDTKINIALELTEDSVQAVKESVGNVTALIGDQETALNGTRKVWLLNKDASDELNASIAEGAATIAYAFSDIDYNELIQETYEVGKELGITQLQAVSLVDSLLKAGFPPDQLDIIAEYGAQLSRAGYNAEEIRSIFAAGVDTGTWNIDVLLDGLKEGRIGLAEMGQGIDDATQEVIKGTDISAEQLKKWGQAIANGGNEGKLAMLEAALALDEIEEGTKKNQVGVALFGTLYEENGQKITDTLLNAKDEVQSMDEMQQGLNDTIEKANGDPFVSIKTAINEMFIAMEPLLNLIAEIVSSLANWMSENPRLAATLTALSVAVGIIAGVILALAPIFAVLKTAAIAAQVSIAGLLAPFALIITIVVAVIAIIVALVAVFVNLYKNNEDFRNKVQEIWGNIQEVFSNVLNFIKDLVQTIMTNVSAFFQETLGKIKAFWDENGQAIMILVQNYMTYIQGAIEVAMIIITTVFKGAWELIQLAVRNAWEAIKLVVRNGIDLILGIIQTVLKLIQGDWKGAWDTILQTLKNIWGNILKYLEAIDLFGTGKQIIQGLIDGIGSMISAVAKKVKEVGSKIADGFKDFFDINSPSRLMRDEIGKNLGAGLAVGMEDSVKRISNASNAMKEAAMPNIEKGTSTGVTNQRTINNNFYPQKAVIDVDDINRMTGRQALLYGG